MNYDLLRWNFPKNLPKQMVHALLASAMRCLMYVMKCPWLDLTFIISMLSWYQLGPGCSCWISTKTILRYLIEKIVHTWRAAAHNTSCNIPNSVGNTCNMIGVPHIWRMMSYSARGRTKHSMCYELRHRWKDAGRWVVWPLSLMKALR